VSFKTPATPPAMRIAKQMFVASVARLASSGSFHDLSQHGSHSKLYLRRYSAYRAPESNWPDSLIRAGTGHVARSGEETSVVCVQLEKRGEIASICVQQLAQIDAFWYPKPSKASCIKQDFWSGRWESNKSE